MLRPELTVIVVSWNARDFLVPCLQSILDATHHCPTEIIVVDNASTDGSAEAVRARYPQVRLIVNSDNLGFARASNIGIRTSQGTFLCLVNSDVIVEKHCIESLMDYMRHHPMVALLGPRIFNSDGSVQQSFGNFPTLWSSFSRALALDKLVAKVALRRRGPQTPPHAREVDVLSGCFWVVRRQSLEQVGLLDETFFIYAEDKDWCKRFSRAKWLVVYYPFAEALHYGGASSARQPVRFYVELYRANLQYWRKHHGPIAQVGIRVIMVLHQLLRLGGASLLYVLLPSRRPSTTDVIQRSLACTLYLLRLSALRPTQAST